jgi:hypothetical protein
MSISPVRTEVTRATDPSSLPVASRTPKISEIPENVFAPPGVFTRLTALLHSYHPPQEVRPEVVSKGKELASSADYPSPAQISRVATELLGVPSEGKSSSI